MKCPVCGAEQPLGMAYCDQCGSPLESDAMSSVADAPVVHDGDASSAVSAVAVAPASDLAAAASVSIPEPAPRPIIPPSVDQNVVEERHDDATGDMSAPVAPPPPVPAGQLTLIFANGAQFVCQNDMTNIGRADAAQDWHPELDVIPFGGGVPEMGVSRHHARIVKQEGKYMLLDVGSTNGTYVNGTAIQYNNPVELHDGDIVALGAFNARIVVRR